MTGGCKAIIDVRDRVFGVEYRIIGRCDYASHGDAIAHHCAHPVIEWASVGAGAWKEGVRR